MGRDAAMMWNGGLMCGITVITGIRPHDAERLEMQEYGAGQHCHCLPAKEMGETLVKKL